MSTNQIVGYVRITKDGNPQIRDTSDREGLVSNSAAADFGSIIRRIVELLANERHIDRTKEDQSGSPKDLFAGLNAETLVADLEALRDRGGGVPEAIVAAKEFGVELERSRATIEKRFGYYNRLAVIGTIAQMVIHEIRNRTTVIGRALEKACELADRAGDGTAVRAVRLAEGSVTALEALADRFSPLASRGYRPGKHISVVEESVSRCVEMLAGDIRSASVDLEAPEGTQTIVRVDPGEIDAIMLNLLSNSLYWLRRIDGARRIRFRVERGSAPGRAKIFVDDSGPGIDSEDRERVFWPGVTRKPNGIGMGLTVASELVDGHGGRMETQVPGEFGGATFGFDLPLVDKDTSSWTEGKDLS